ncbi:helix-turn-helix transcriptional regulator [Hymenobacter sp. RP-2-7]|uniref:Helix-turn-helix transcriptional regulator n=1 Tax=Hymenobacter polaris TaxID=2682546 RepID=A0A7Y0AIP1_9BACT|nr:helix-turn-helix transcriptional regulator [Hymenobacter polaris]NML67805.1 helix-turn-helix transcriptional regulator [Hymenobacter polaris]
MDDEALISQKIAEIAATADQYPCVVIIHHVPTQTVRYMSAWGLRLLGATLEELRALGPQFSPTYFNTAESDEYVAQAFELVHKNSQPEVQTCFQQARTTERPGWSWYLTAMRRLLSDAQGAPLLLLCLAVPLHPDNHFAAKVQRLIDDNGFLRANSSRYATLTTRERAVLRLLALGHSAAEIAGQLFISVQTAETHRRNIRHKLAAPSLFELGQYARAFDLI